MRGTSTVCSPLTLGPCLLACLQVASGAEELVQNITVVEQLQDALADTVGECLTDYHAAAERTKQSEVAYM